MFIRKKSVYQYTSFSFSGDCNEMCSSFDVSRTTKLRAWRSKYGLGRLEAEKLYVELVQQLYGADGAVIEVILNLFIFILRFILRFFRCLHTFFLF